MHKKTIQILTGLLAVQVLLFALLFLSKQGGGEFSKSQKLLNVDVDSLTAISVAGEGKNLELKKVDGSWQLPGYFDFPASEPKVRDIVGQLAGFKVHWPVGSTMIAAKQFKVIDDQFERKVDFVAGDSKTTLYIGSSPSFKKVHARVDPSENTYSIDFNAFDIPHESSGWMDKKYFEIKRTDVKSLSVNGMTLENKEGSFELSDLADGKEMDVIKVNPLMSAALSPDFEEVLGREDVLDTAATEELTYRVHTASGDDIVYSFRTLADKADPKKEKKQEEAKESEFLTLKVSNRPYVAKVRRTRIAAILKARRDELMKDKPKSEADSAPGGDETTGALDDAKGASKSDDSPLLSTPG